MDNGFDLVGELQKAKSIDDLEEIARLILNQVKKIKSRSDFSEFTKISVEPVLINGMLNGITINGIILETEEEAKERAHALFVKRTIDKKARQKKNALLVSAIESAYEEDDDY